MTSKSYTHQEYEKLCHEIWEHNRRYYIEAQPSISDEEFDALLKRLMAIEKVHPEWITPNSPTQRVNEMLTTGFKTVKHTTPMLSLANTYSKEELEDFINACINLSKNPTLLIHVNSKWMELQYLSAMKKAYMCVE
jgi:NAD-dependent DNA ligase